MNTFTAVLQGVEKSNQGGLVHVATDRTQLERFLVLGTWGGSFYVGEFDLTKHSYETIQREYARNYQETIDTIVAISDQGRAPSNSPALFALAVGASYKGDNMQTIRAAALAALPKVARTGTHLFEFVGYVTSARGWGSGLKRGIGNWYLSQSPRSLAYGVTKYVQREGWSHADLLRLAHPSVPNSEYDAIFKYVVDGDLGKFEAQTEARSYLEAVEEAKSLRNNPQRAVELIQQFNIPREVLPTELLNDPLVWEALLYGPMPVMAMVRNAGNLHRAGLINRFGDAQKFYVERLGNQDVIRKSRIHPFDIVKASLAYDDSAYSALNPYGEYRNRGKRVENPSQVIIRSLIDAADLAFQNVVPSGKGVIQGIDVSGSMNSPVSTLPIVTSSMAAAYMAYQSVRVEPFVETFLFETGLKRVTLPRDGGMLAVARKVNGYNWGGTDIPLVIRTATAQRTMCDLFAIYTDNENGNRGETTTHALDAYRSKVNPDARLVIISTEVNRWSNTGNQPNTLDVTGFDTSVARVVSEFARGEI